MHAKELEATNAVHCQYCGKSAPRLMKMFNMLLCPACKQRFLK